MAGNRPRTFHPLAGPAALILILLIAAPGLTKGGSGGGSSPQQQQGECPNKHDEPEFTGHGANQSGAYNDTCPESGQSQNGGGNTNNPHCAGCVGNADDKNPPGQDPQGAGGDDPNAGYECDRNQGVGKTNPAHSGCARYPIE